MYVGDSFFQIYTCSWEKLEEGGNTTSIDPETAINGEVESLLDLLPLKELLVEALMNKSPNTWQYHVGFTTNWSQT